MNSIKIIVTEEQKKAIKKQAIDNEKTLTRFFLDLLKEHNGKGGNKE